MKCTLNISSAWQESWHYDIQLLWVHDNDFFYSKSKNRKQSLMIFHWLFSLISKKFCVATDWFQTLGNLWQFWGVGRDFSSGGNPIFTTVEVSRLSFQLHAKHSVQLWRVGAVVSSILSPVGGVFQAIQAGQRESSFSEIKTAISNQTSLK